MTDISYKKGVHSKFPKNMVYVKDILYVYETTTKPCETIQIDK